MTARLLFLDVALLLAMGAGATLAHAALDASQPAAETSVTGPLREIDLHFSEPVEVNFSRIEVHALDASDVDATDEDAWQRLTGLAGVLVSEALGDAREEGSGLDVELASEEARVSDIRTNCEKPRQRASTW